MTNTTKVQSLMDSLKKEIEDAITKNEGDDYLISKNLSQFRQQFGNSFFCNVRVPHTERFSEDEKKSVKSFRSWLNKLDIGFFSNAEIEAFAECVESYYMLYALGVEPEP